MASQASGATTAGDMTQMGMRPNSYGGSKRLGQRGISVADQNFGVNAQSMLPNVNDNNLSSQPFSASGSFLDAKSNSIGGGQQQPNTSQILFLKRLLFLKAALDNDQSLSNFAVPFEEDKAFHLKSGESRPLGYSSNGGESAGNNRPGLMTAPADGNGKRTRLVQHSQPFHLEADQEEKPLPITNGGFNDDLNDSQPPMKALLPPNAPPRPSKTAQSRHRPNKKRGGNSLNLHAAESRGSQQRLQ